MAAAPRVLVTGASGLLGSSLVPFLERSGYVVTRHAHTSTADVRVDLTDRALTESLLDSVNPEVIVNLVGLTDVDRCQEDLRNAYRLNVRTVENLSGWIVKNQTGFLVHISTDQVYDGPGPHAEDRVEISNVYGLSKYASELAALRASGAVLRTNFFGYSLCEGRTSLSDWILESLASGTEVGVFTDVLFSPVSLPTLVSNLELVMGSKHTGVFNLGSHGGMSKADFAFELARTFELSTENLHRTTSVERGFAAYRPKDMRMNSGRFERRFGVRLPTLVDEIGALKGGVDA